MQTAALLESLHPQRRFSHSRSPASAGAYCLLLHTRRTACRTARCGRSAYSASDSPLGLDTCYCTGPEPLATFLSSVRLRLQREDTVHSAFFAPAHHFVSMICRFPAVHLLPFSSQLAGGGSSQRDRQPPDSERTVRVPAGLTDSPDSTSNTPSSLPLRLTPILHDQSPRRHHATR